MLFPHLTPLKQSVTPKIVKLTNHAPSQQEVRQTGMIGSDVNKRRGVLLD